MMIVEKTFSRRELLKRLGITGAAAIGLTELSRVLVFQREVLASQGGQPGVTRALTDVELATLGAVCARIIPSDENGPGATEARAARYIERALSGWLSPSRDVYRAGLAMLDETSQKRNGRRFLELSGANQDAVLRDVEQTPFFALVRMHTIQGTFCDPAYGGNANFVGWDLVGYPGVRLVVTPEEQRMASPAKPMRRSAYEYAMFSAIEVTHAH